MLSSLFNSSTVPVLEQVVNFTEARHGVLAGNIANIDTPGYKTRDISPALFQKRLKEAVQYRREATQSPTYAQPYDIAGAQLAGRSARVSSAMGRDGMKEVRESVKSILYHDDSNVSIEQQVTEISKNQAQHNMAVSLMTAQFRLLRAAITERA
ncbi:MAG: flagellar basal body rod protein FlgB [Planctomycetes bacterium]|nr:flagellar basal body rod protein FlgB [Planctomycetota bacterium]